MELLNIKCETNQILKTYPTFDTQNLSFTPSQKVSLQAPGSGFCRKYL